MHVNEPGQSNCDFLHYVHTANKFSPLLLVKLCHCGILTKLGDVGKGILRQNKKNSYVTHFGQPRRSCQHKKTHKRKYRWVPVMGSQIV